MRTTYPDTLPTSLYYKRLIEIGESYNETRICASCNEFRHEVKMLGSVCTNCVGSADIKEFSVKYGIVPGQKGGRDTEPIPESIEILSVKFKGLDLTDFIHAYRPDFKQDFTEYITR